MHQDFCPNFVPHRGLKVLISHKKKIKYIYKSMTYIALLTIYDMCKAVDRGMTMTDVRVLEKHGGKSGIYVNP